MKKYSFIDILTKEILIQEKIDRQEERKILFSKIEIPRIQRDYAQGRSIKKDDKLILNETGEKFLTALFAALKSGKKLTLDFVYGSVENDNFIPLDGQQRLTTLFLLHWYIGVKENKIDEKLINLLKKFTYETRTSSRDFCKNLCEVKIDYTKNPSAEIENLSWFFKSYKKDPTIHAMLNMLDAIHAKYAEIGKSDLFEKLNNLQFYILPFESFNLTEDLYIKINARGKQLTAFENFKADFENHITQSDWEKNTEYEETFASKADKIWTDLFWKHKDENNEIDFAYIKFIANVAMFLYAEFDVRDKERRIQDLFNNPENVNPSDFDTIEKFNFLKSVLDIYVQKHEQKISVALWNTGNCFFNESITYEVKKENGADVIKYSATYPQLVFFFAQTLFFEKKLSTGFEDWMRVVRNILQNSTVDSSSTFIGAANLINEISVGSNDIYNWLATNSVKSNFAKEQVTEEIIKAKIIQSNAANKAIIHQTEDTNFCKGRIDFALYCIDSENEANFNNFSSEKLGKIKAVFETHFDTDIVSNDFRRAMFTIGNNDFHYYLSWSYRLVLHKYCLIIDTNDLKNKYANQNSEYLKELVNKLTTKTLEQIIDGFVCPDNMPNWKKRLIKEKDLLEEHCQGHCFGIEKDNSGCYLFYGYQRPSSKDQCYCVK